MKVAVFYSSLLVGERIMNLLAEKGGVVVAGRRLQTDESSQIIAALEPNLVIIDAELKSGAGLEMLRRVNALPCPPITVMTASMTFRQYRHRCLTDGASYFFELPGEFDKLSALVGELAAKGLE
jgi:DNA-binding response OmpR family regulator